MAQEPGSSPNLSDELGKMVNQVAEAVRLAWESDERKRLQAEFSTNVRSFATQGDEAVRKASVSDTAKKVRTQAEEAAAKARESDVVDDMREGLLVGLQAINRELGKLLDRLQATPATQAPATTGPIPPEAPAAPAETEPPVGPSVEI